MSGERASVRFGVVLPTFCGGEYGEQPASLSDLCELAGEAERSGLDSVWVIEHLLVASPRYRTSWMEPLTVLSFIASRTRRLRLGTSILILPLRSPIQLAKTAATLDHLSGGRLVLGVGAGWHRGEFEAMGADFSRRGRIMDEQLPMLRKLLSGETATYHGRFYHIDGVKIDPKPAQRPGVPIWIGGGGMGPTEGAGRVLRRIATLGDGWIARPTGDTESLAEWWGAIRRYAAEAGRSLEGFPFAQLNFTYLTRRVGGDAVGAFSRIVNLPIDEVRRTYVVGDEAEIAGRIRRLISIGLNYYIAWLTGMDYETLRFIAEELAPTYSP